MSFRPFKAPTIIRPAPSVVRKDQQFINQFGKENSNAGDAE
jgi:hypothetical protein